MAEIISVTMPDGASRCRTLVYPRTAAADRCHSHQERDGCEGRLRIAEVAPRPATVAIASPDGDPTEKRKKENREERHGHAPHCPMPHQGIRSTPRRHVRRHAGQQQRQSPHRPLRLRSGRRRRSGRLLNIGQVPGQYLRHLRRRLKPQVRVLLQQPLNYVAQPRGDFRIHFRDRPRSVLGHPLDHRRQAIAAERADGQYTWRTARSPD